LAISLLTGAAPPPQSAVGAQLQVDVAQLRSAKGLIHICLTRDASAFPDCRRDPGARRTSVGAASANPVSFVELEPGTYAISLVHDENGNGRLDTLAAVPREGFGFSGSDRLRLGPARFEEAAFRVHAGPNRRTIRVRYVL